MNSQPILLNEKQAAEILNISRRTLSRLTANGEVPSVKIGRLRRYSRQALLDWIETKSGPST